MKLVRASREDGFTLIELLVVISIIGLTASIVLASLTTARTKAADSAIKANMKTVQNAAALYFDSQAGSYGAAFPIYNANANPCNNQNLANVFADTQVKAAITASRNLSSTANATCAIGPGGQSYAISVGLKSGGLWCVSSGGEAKLAAAFGDDTNPAFCDDGN